MKTKYNRIKETLVVLFLVLFLVTLTAATASAAIDMTQYNGKVLYVNGNGYSGKTSDLTFYKQDDGSYTFSTVLKMTGEISDAISGKVFDRHITFTRTRPKSFVQHYDGWLFEKSPKWMAGTFDHNNAGTYGWYGYIQ